MLKKISLLFLLLCICVESEAIILKTKKTISYPLVENPIDAVIVSHPKDKPTIDLCIDGIKKNCSNIRRIIVVSSTKLTENAEWFNERNFPFSKKDIELEIGRGDIEAGKKFFRNVQQNVGWYFQQLLKLYSAYVIPDISPNVLVVDADTVFLNPVDFLNSSFGGLFCTSSMPAKSRYLNHARRLVPNYKRVYPKYYSVCHHMLFQKPILDDLFKEVENRHKMLFWKAFCRCVDLKEGGASEYEIYYSFALGRTKQVELRHLKWQNSPYLGLMRQYQDEGYHFVSFHTYLRKQNSLRF